MSSLHAMRLWSGGSKRDHYIFPRGNVGDTSNGTPLFDQAAQDEYKKIISEIYTRGVKHGITMNMGESQDALIGLWMFWRVCNWCTMRF